MFEHRSQTPASSQVEPRVSAAEKDRKDIRAQHPSGDVIDRRSGLSYEEFVKRYRDPRLPVILNDAISGWPALSKWSPEYFKKHYSSTLVAVRGRYAADEEPRRSLGELIDELLASSASAPAPYLKNQNLIDAHPELRADMSPIPEYAFPNWLDGPFSAKLHHRFHRGDPELQIGGAGVAFPSMHYDYGLVHTFISQIYGCKKVKAFSPDQSRFVYPESGENQHGSRIPDIDHVDLEKFPLFSRAVAVTADLNPGDTLFVPAGWWHTTRVLSASITASFNFANSSNWSDLSRACGFLVPFFPRLRFETYLFALRIFRTILGR